MGLEVAIAAAGLALAGAGTYMQYQGQKQAKGAQDDALRQQQEIEKKRQQQMELDASRRKREMVRQQLAARSAALATAQAQGANGEGSSALPGAYGGISGRTNENQLGVNQNLELGRGIFDLNEGILGSYRSAAAAGSYAAMGSGLNSIGGAILRNTGVIDRIGTWLGGQFSSPSYGGGSFAAGYAAQKI